MANVLPESSCMYFIGQLEGELTPSEESSFAEWLVELKLLGVEE